MIIESKGKRFVNAGVGYIVGGTTLLGAIIISPLLLLITGTLKCGEVVADYTFEKLDKKKHDKKMKNDWYYRLLHSAPRIKDLKVWQEHIQNLDQYERAVLQIAEAGDVPFELWSYLQEVSEFDNLQRIYGTTEYRNIQSHVVQKAFCFYVSKYSAFMRIPLEDADIHLRNIVASYGFFRMFDKSDILDPEGMFALQPPCLITNNK